MGQKHSRPSRRPGQNQDRLLQGEQQQQPSSQQPQQQQPPQQAAGGYAPSQVYQQVPCGGASSCETEPWPASLLGVPRGI